MLKQFFLVVLLLLAQLGHAETPAEANKRLFDKTIDELNFRTMETVYDKSFTRGKFPITLRTAAARRSFDEFGNNTALKQLFMNYNGVAERYKNRYGNGPNTLDEFENQLKSVLLDKNFEFFIHNLPRDERVALVRAEQRLIQQATAQFNASGAPEDVAAVPPADVDAQPEEAVTAPLTTITDASAETTADSNEQPLTSPGASGPSPNRTWFDYLQFFMSLSSFLLLLYLATTVLPAMSRRINNLSADPEPEPEPRSIASRLRPNRSQGLREDRYEEEEDDYEPTGPARPRDDD